MNVFNNVILARNRQLPDDDRMIETCRSIFKNSFNINDLSVCIGWCADQVFYNLELAALLLLNKTIYLTNAIPSYPIVARRQYTTVEKSPINRLAETFIEHFVAIAENVNRQRKNNLINDDNDNMDCESHFVEQAFNKPYQSTERKCTTTKETERITKSLKTKNAYGYDEISTKILKISCPFITSPINYIRNKMLFGVYSLID